MSNPATHGDHWDAPPDSVLHFRDADETDHPPSQPDDAAVADGPWAGNQAQEDTGVFGTPAEDVSYWQPQTTAFTSVVMAERGIIEALTGEDVSEAQLVYEATACGLLTDDGMSPEDVGEILRMHGVPCHHNDRATIEDIVAELSLGHKVIVGVDAAELRDPAHPLADFTGQAADHAIWVTGVDESDPDHAKVIINDSGDPHGAGRAYDLDRFVDAWEDAGFRYVATDGAPDHEFADAIGIAPAAALGLLMAVRLSAREAATGADAPQQLSAVTLRALEDGRSKRQHLDFANLDQGARDALIRRL